MPFTALDAKTALIVIDLQKGIVTIPVVHPIDGVITKAQTLMRAFRANGLPVVLVNVAGGAPGRTEQSLARPRPEGWADLIPELERAPEDYLVTKHTWGAFTNTGLAEQLKSLGVTQVVLCGVATSAGVESTARQAHELGLNVTLAVDAMTDIHADAHDNSIRRIFPRLGETGTAAEIVALTKVHLPSRAM